MAKIISKGTVLKKTISASLTAISQVLSIDQSGCENETFETTTLDNSDAGKTHKATGYTEPGTLDFELFYDPDNSGHQDITDLAATPAEVAWTVTYTDGTPTVETYTVAGVTVGRSVAMNDGVKMSVSCKLTGLIGFST